MKMILSLFFISLITIYILPKTYSQGSRKVPGSVSCGYFGALEEICNEEIVPASNLPKEAKSIFYSGIGVDATLKVEFGYDNRSNDVHMKSMLNTGTPVFLLYYHQGDDQLMSKISNNFQDGGVNAKTEMSNLKTFLEPYNDVAGFSVYGLSYSANYTTTPCLTENFQIYIDEMRSCFPDKGIGLSIDGIYLTDMFAKSNPPVWLDISVLDSHFDFYTIDVHFLNLCTEDIEAVGITPINGSTPYTLDVIKDLLGRVGVPKEKTYYIYGATYGMSSNLNLTTCDIRNAKMCADPSIADCPETTQSLFDKGAFANLNGAGVIVWDVDLDDDPHGCCQCNPYPAFHSIMAGFNSDPVPPVCSLLEQ